MEGRHARNAALFADCSFDSVTHWDRSDRTTWSTGAIAIGLFCITLALLSGCQDQTSFIPNSDPALRKTKTEFAKDALTRQPYHADAPKGGKLNGSARVDYDDDNLQIANFTKEDWKNVEIWVNSQWVVFLPTVPANADTVRTIDFSMLYDALGRPFPSENTNPDSYVKKVEVFRDGKMYELAGLTFE